MSKPRKSTGRGVELKLKNRRVHLHHLEPEYGEDGFTTEWNVRFTALTKDRKIRVTEFQLSDEALEGLVLSYLHLKHKDKQFKKWVQDMITNLSSIAHALIQREATKP